MNLEALEKLIKGRRSIRKWSKKEVPDELLKKAVELAIWAPNGGNFQGWHFLIVKNKEVIVEITDTVQSVTDKIASWPEAAPWEEDIQRYKKNPSLFKEAPVIIGVFTTQYQSVMDSVLMARESFDPEAKRIMGFRRSAPTAVQSAAAAVTTMLLVFHQMGLGAVWLGAPLMAKKEIETILKVPKDISLICLIAVGYPDEAPQKERKAVDEVIRFIH